MLRKLFTRIIQSKKNNYNVNNSSPEDSSISKKLEKNEQVLHEKLRLSSDLRIREFVIGSQAKTPVNAMIAFVDGMCSSIYVNRDIIGPLMHKSINSEEKIEDFVKQSLVACDVQIISKIDKCINSIMEGGSVLFIDGYNAAIVIDSKGYPKRAVEAPSNEVVMRGPNASFTEHLRTNTALVRRCIKDNKLAFEKAEIGRRTKTIINIVYIDGIANDKLINSVRRRLDDIDTDAILDSGYIEQYIEDRPFSIFATLGNTQKPDVFAAKLLEGRVGILVDGSPIALTAPFLFQESFQNAEDYYTKPFYATLVRIIRYLAFLATIITPAAFVALTVFHQELIPTSLLFSMAKAGSGVPFNSFHETVILLSVFELLKEAGMHMPKSMGQTISIVGALVMGETCVSAGLISAPIVIVVAFTAVTGYVVNPLHEQGTLLRWGLLIVTGFMGVFGLILGLIVLLIHLVSITSFGFPYLSPYADFEPGDIKDSFLRMPLWYMVKRPSGMSNGNRVRTDTPVPPAEKK